MTANRIDGECSPLTTSAVFRLLADPRRRRIIDILYTHDCSMTLADLAEEAIAHECDVPFAAIPEKDVTEVHLELYHSHVPKLEEYGIAIYDQEEGRVAPRGHSDRIEAVLELSNEWSSED